MDGKELKQRRLSLVLTQKQLAEKIGYTENYIYMLEAGKAEIKKPMQIDLLLKSLEIESFLKKDKNNT